MAVNDRRNDKTLFINVLCFGKMAENLQPRLLKGRPVSIQGKLNIDDYEDENQNKRSSVCIMADEISLGQSPSSSEEQLVGAVSELKNING
jgi:single-stranded DNA-binding protein